MKKRLLNEKYLQSKENENYSGTESLFNFENYLCNYNTWIIKSFLHHYCVIRPPISNDNKVLDFGAGIGALSKIFFELTGVRPDCVEIDSEQRKIIGDMGFNSYFTLEEVNDNYDLIYSSNVLEHIEDDVSALSKLRKKLSNKGVLIIYVPAFNQIWTSLDTLVGHQRRYIKKSLVDKLKKSGFRVINSNYFDSLGFFLALIYKFIGSKHRIPHSTFLLLFDKFLLPISKFMDVIVRRRFGKNLLVVAILNQETVYCSNDQ